MNTAKFSSSNGFSPRVWGPMLWHVAHIMTANFPLVPTRKESAAYFTFFRSLCTLLPCGRCRQEFCMIMNSPTSALRLRQTIFGQSRAERPGTARKRVFRWFVLVHANVNSRLHKKYSGNPDTWARKYAQLRSTA